MAVYDEDSKDLLRGVIQSPHSNCCYDIKLNTGEIKSVEDIWVMVSNNIFGLQFDVWPFI